MDKPQDTDYYLETGFTEAAGYLEPNQSIEIQNRFSKSNWSNYNQSNDTLQR